MKNERERTMCTRWLPIKVLAYIALASPAAAHPAADEVAELYFNTIKPGMGYVYELGRKNHMAFHALQHDTMTWFTWEVVTGEGVGNYIMGTFGHSWKDFDGREAFDAVDGPDADANMGPSEAGSQQAFYLYRRDLSRRDPSAQAPSKFTVLTIYRIAPEGVNDFSSGVAKIKMAQDRANWPGHSDWYELANGGDGPTFLLRESRASWAEFQSPDKSLDELMRENYGRDGITALSAMRRAIRSTYSEVIKYRPDLSYVAQPH
jgi:hypothetical protein